MVLIRERHSELIGGAMEGEVQGRGKGESESRVTDVGVRGIESARGMTFPGQTREGARQQARG